MIKRLLLITTVIAFSLVQAQAQDSYTSTLKKYFEVSGSLQAFKSAITSMMGNFKNMNTQAPEEFWNEMEVEMMKTSVDDLVVQMTPIYKKHLTESELNDVIKFYGSAVGKKLAEKTPLITQESMQAGQIWGQAIASKVLQKLKEKGY